MRNNLSLQNFNKCLTLCVSFQPRDVLCGAADEVLATLKSDHMKEKEKKKEISALLGALDEEQFAMLSGLGRRITDYGADKGAGVESKWWCGLTCMHAWRPSPTPVLPAAEWQLLYGSWVGCGGQ